MMIQTDKPLAEGVSLYGEDYARPPCVLTGRRANVLKNKRICVPLNATPPHSSLANVAESILGSRERYVDVRCHGREMLFWSKHWTKEKHIPAKPTAYPFGLVSDQVRENTNGRVYYRFLHFHNADQYTWAGPACVGHRPAHVIDSWYKSAQRAIRTGNPATDIVQRYEYAFDQKLFDGGNLWTLTLFNEEKFVSRWEPAIRERRTSRSEMYTKLSQLIEKKAPRTYYEDWRNYLVNDMHADCDDYRHVFWSAAHAINGRNILTGDYQRFERFE